ncbi:MAG: TonB-dependent receptor [Chitinophagales bacterium]|nr:TonB-dependent receptor [Chitinophagales bacterium]
MRSLASIILILIMLMVAQTANCQDTTGVRITKIYNASLEEVLDRISSEYGLRFQFNRAQFRKIQCTYAFWGLPIEQEMKKLCQRFDLNYTFNDGFVIALQLKDPSSVPVSNSDKDEVDVTGPVPLENSVYKGAFEKTNVTVTGRVVDAKTGESLPFVTVGVKGTTLATTTNLDGFFSLLKVPNDTCSLQFSYLGYQNYTHHLSPKEPLSDIKIEMSSSNLQLGTVTVVATAKERLMETGEKPGMIKMTPAKLDVLPNLGEKDIFRSFQLMPGVSAANESSSGLYVRGSTPDQSLVLYDGFTIYHVDHLFGFFSAFNANAIKDVQLYRGGFESKYGGRLGSVVDITGKEGNTKKWNAGGSLSLLGMNLWLEVPIKEHFTSLIAFRTSYQGLIYNKIFNQFNSDDDRPSNGPSGGGPLSQNTTPSSNFYDLNVKLAYKYGKNLKNNLTLSLFNSRDKLDNGQKIELPSFLADQDIDFNLNINDLTKYGNTGASIKYSRQFTDKIYANTILSISNYYSNRDRSVEGSITDSSGAENTFKNGTLENNKIIDAAFKSDLAIGLTDWNKIELGVLGNYYKIDYSYSQNDSTTILKRNDRQQSVALYLQDNIQLFDNRIKLLPGIRGTYYTGTSRMYYEPRANMEINITTGLKFQAAWGVYYQFANRVVREDILQGSRDFWILSDDDKVPVSKSIHYIAGINYDWKWFNFSVEGYYKNLSNLTQYSLRIKPSIGEANYEESFFNGTGIAKGVDFTLMTKVKGYSGWLTYTLGKVDYHFDAFSKNDFPADHDVRHEFKMVHTYKYKRFDCSVTWLFSTGKPYTSPEGGYELTLLDGTSVDLISVSDKNSKRLPNYHRMDISANYNFPTKTGGNFAIGLSIFNLYNRKNVWYKQYNIDSGQIIETNVNYLSLTPNVSLNYRFR